MTAKTKAQLYTEIDTNYPDNTSGLITPAIQRTTEKDTVDSWQQAPVVNLQLGSAYSITADDFGKLVLFNSATAVGVTLPQAIGTFANFNVMVANIGTGLVTITPTVSSIGGAATLQLAQRQCQTIVSDGANYQLAQNTAVTVGGSGAFPVFNDPISGLILRPIVSTDLPACQFAGLGAVKAFAPVSNKFLQSLDEGGAFNAVQPDVSMFPAGQLRERVTANRAYFVRTTPVNVTVPVASPGVVTWNAHGLAANAEVFFSNIRQQAAVTVTIASPAVVTWTGHGLAVGQPVKFSTSGALPTGIQPESQATVSIASPGVVTWNAHGLVAGQPFQFRTNGALPTGITAGTTYFVIATGLTANTFQFSTTAGGAAVNTSGTQSGTHFISPNYYVIAAGLGTNAFQIAATAGGAAINTSGTQSGTHFGEKFALLPTGLVEGTTYFVVGASITANTFQVSTTANGAAINFTGATEGQISASTGSDTLNNGLSVTTPFSTIQKGIDTLAALDLGIFNGTVNAAAGTYTQQLTAKSYVGTGPINIVGASKETTTINLASGFPFNSQIPQRYVINGFRLIASGIGFNCVLMGRAAQVDLQNIDFGPCGGAHVSLTNTAIVNILSAYMVSGGCGNHVSAAANCTFAAGGKTITFLNTPLFTVNFLQSVQGGIIIYNANTFVGAISASTLSAAVSTNAVIDCQIGTNTGAAAYLPGSHTFTETGGGVLL